MPTDDEIRIILNVLNTEKVEDARKAIEREEEAIRQLGAQLKAGAVSQAAFDAATSRSAQNIQAATAQIKSATKGGFNPQSLLEFSRAAEDAQYGIAGVVNNIPGLVASLGGGSGVVGVASLAAIGIAQLVKNWDGLAAAFGASKTLSEAAQMDELAKSTKLAADQADRLARYRAIGAKSAEIQGASTEEEKRIEAAATKAITEAGQDDVVRGLLKADPAAFDAAIPGITDDKDNLLQNGKGENRTAVTDARDAQQALDDHISGKGRRRDLGAKGESFTEEVRPEELQRLQTAAAAAEKALAEARIKAARDNLSAGTLAKYYPGGADKLRSAVEANPENFGPKAGQLADALRDAIKNPNDREVEAERAERAERANAAEKERVDREFAAWVKENGLDPRTGEKILTGGAKAEADETDGQYAERLQRERREFNERFANAQYEAGKKIQDEDEAARVQDRTTEWRKDWARTHRSAEVLSLDGLRDSIQTAQRKDNEPTAVETLKAQREAVAEQKKATEVLNTIARRVGGPARAG